MVEFFVLVGPLAIIVTKVVDAIRNAADRDGSAPKVVWNLAALGVGVVVALLWQIDYHGLIEGLPPVLARLDGVWGQVVTGLGIGAVASGWHEAFDYLSSTAKARRPS